MRRGRLVLAVVVELFAIRGAAGQESLQAPCEHAAVTAAGAHSTCLAAAQAVVSAPPIVGLLMTGGSPAIGTSGGTGFSLGFIPRLSAGLRLTAVPVRLPDLLVNQLSGTAGSAVERYRAAAPSLAADLAATVNQGFTVSPGFAGVGGLDLLGSVAYLPFDLFADGFGESELAYGFGATIHVVNESFVAPGATFSLTRRNLTKASFGDICPAGIAPVTGLPPTEGGACTGSGTIGDFSFDLSSWSGRLVLSKQLLGAGAAIGLGRDWYQTDVVYGFRGRTVQDITTVFRTSQEDLESSHWTVFGNLAFTFVVATAVLEAGWQQGTEPLSGFRSFESEFDPDSGTWFGSIGGRLSL